MTPASLAPDCSESTVRRRRFLPPESVQAHLHTSVPDFEQRMMLYGALAGALVWVTECEVGLADAGPFLELRPMDTIAGRLLAIFTDRTRSPCGGATAEPIAFAKLIAGLPDDVSLLIDPIEAAVVIPPRDIVVLRETLAERR